MILSLKGFSQMVSDSAAAVQSKCSTLINLASGSVLRAVLEAYAGVGLWIQYLILLVWQGARLTTATGVDVDSFVGDFGLTRLPAVPASGEVTFARFSTATAAVVPLGTTVTTADLSESYAVIQDTSNAAWNAAQNAYVLPVGTVSADIPVSAVTSGSSGNIQAGQISLVSAALPGIDTVTNAAPFENGADPEGDAALKARFSAYINTRTRATLAAIGVAITSVQQGLTYSIAENQDTTGAVRMGNFVVTVDNGTGNPPAALIAQVAAAVNAVRPIGSTFSVVAPQLVTVPITLTLTIGPNGTRATVALNVQNAILDYVDALTIGAMLPYSAIARVAWDADPNITNVSQITVNGGTADIAGVLGTVIRAGVVTIN